MVNLYVFDCDGTLEVSGGPVPLSFLDGLRGLGHPVCIVSPSPRCSNLPYEYHIGQDRLANLLDAKKAHPNCTFYYYFTDNPGEEGLGQSSGFTVVKVV